MMEFDPGPPPGFADIFERLPDYTPHKDNFWFDWETVFYRGRLDGTARVLFVASDPGPAERIACRTLVGDAGQRVQGLFRKIGLSRSYLCLNAFAYALFPGKFFLGTEILNDPALTAWRNELFDKVKTPALQAIIAAGMHAQTAVSLWPGSASLPVFPVPHPSSHDEKKITDSWREAVIALRAIVTPDSDGDTNLPNYGEAILEEDYARIPRRDLPFGLPSWFGDDSWGRLAVPRHRNSVKRPDPDDRHTLIWIAPVG
jgi:uracil-DNA glycosylase